MGKQTQRQKAKARDAVPEGPDPETPNLCCLPHCEEPGEKLECGHSLCGMDMLKLTRYVSQIKEFRMTCPMCRNVCIIDPSLLMNLMNTHLEFKCAIFKCGCVTPGCSRRFTCTIRPCKSHDSYTCNVCKGNKRSMLIISHEDDMDTPVGDVLVPPQHLDSFIRGLSEALNSRRLS